MEKYDKKQVKKGENMKITKIKLSPNIPVKSAVTFVPIKPGL